ncbi:MAG: hypothetical protein KC561_13720, partial [Myxococcales bacterium]|nr:hypothetical protein [Myxococcales bacterium]
MSDGLNLATAQAQVVQQLYRLFKLALIHDLRNDAVARAIEGAAQFFRDVPRESEEGISVLFLGDSVFVDGQLLKAERSVYDAAIELGERLDALKINQIEISPKLTGEDIRAGLLYYVAAGKGQAAEGVSSRFALKQVQSALQLDGDDSDVTIEEQIAQTYGYAIVAMRRLFEEVKDGRYHVSRYVKRLAQRLVMLADAHPDAMVSLTSMRDSNNDEAGRAVNCAILAIVMARQLTRDLRFLSRIALSAMFHDVGMPRAAGMGRPDPTRLTNAIPRLNAEQQERVPACSAMVLTALGRLHEDATYRTVIGYEAQWIRRPGVLGPLYDGALPPSVEAELVYIVWKFNTLMAFDVWNKREFSIDEVVHLMVRDSTGEVENTLIEMLLSALGLYPAGSIVELTSGWHGVVARNVADVAMFNHPEVYLVVDPSGNIVKPTVVDLYEGLREGGKFGEIKGLLDRGEPTLGEVARRLNQHIAGRLPEAFERSPRKLLQSTETSRSSHREL